MKDFVERKKSSTFAQICAYVLCAPEYSSFTSYFYTMRHMKSIYLSIYLSIYRTAVL